MSQSDCQHEWWTLSWKEKNHFEWTDKFVTCKYSKEIKDKLGDKNVEKNKSDVQQCVAKISVIIDEVVRDCTVEKIEMHLAGGC